MPALIAIRPDFGQNAPEVFVIDCALLGSTIDYFGFAQMLNSNMAFLGSFGVKWSNALRGVLLHSAPGLLSMILVLGPVTRFRMNCLNTDSKSDGKFSGVPSLVAPIEVLIIL